MIFSNGRTHANANNIFFGFIEKRRAQKSAESKEARHSFQPKFLVLGLKFVTVLRLGRPRRFASIMAAAGKDQTKAKEPSEEEKDKSKDEKNGEEEKEEKKDANTLTFEGSLCARCSYRGSVEQL